MKKNIHEKKVIQIKNQYGLLCVWKTRQMVVFMKYCLDNEGFDWSDYKEIPFNHLETVARKYVNSFNCTDLYVREEDTEEDTAVKKNKQLIVNIVAIL